jgi:hypothetical protein
MALSVRCQSFVAYVYGTKGWQRKGSGFRLSQDFEAHAFFFFFSIPALILSKSSWSLSRTDFSSTEKSLNSV